MADTTLVEPGAGAPAPMGSNNNSAAVYIASLAPSGRYSMMRALDRVAGMLGHTWRTMPWPQLRYEHVQAVRTKLAERFKSATVNATLCGLRRVAQEAWRLRQIDAETYARIRDVPTVTGSTVPTDRKVGAGEMGAILAACASDPSPAGVRDGAIIALAYGGGLRRAELAGLTLDALGEDDGQVIALKIVGKRRKERIVYLDNGGAMALRDWLAVRGDAPGPLFYRGRRGGHLEGGAGMTPQAIRDVIVRRARLAEVADVTPHDLRRTFVSDLLDGGVDTATVAKMAGHANVQTTARYDRRSAEAQRRAAGVIRVPYTGRDVPESE
ncbi:MAG: tyrosine-type recombinase/integrase [Chloroflexi bacterium]|nr:tyrosine-type recombinase/integrase [Chloroflexota bacterium]